MAIKSRRAPHPPWWFRWPQVRWYSGVDTLYYLRYCPYRRGVGLVWWCPSSWVAAPQACPLPAGFEEDLTVKKPVKSNPGGPDRAADPSQLEEDYPLLADQLTATHYDGDPPGSRQTATLLIFCQQGTYRACLRDRQEERCLWVSCVEWHDLLLLVETALSD